MLNTVLIKAQPTLTALTSIPTAGLSEVYNENRTYLAGPEGANQTWDFSTQFFFLQKDYIFEPCNNSNNCSMFPGTTIVGHQINDSSYKYFKGDQNVLSLTGVAVTNQNGIPYPYDNFQDYLHFPFTYGDSFVDSWHTGYSSSSGNSFSHAGIDSVVADGWGTLITPVGTFVNTLRIKKISNYTDSFGSGANSIINYKSISYTWYDIMHKDILYSTSTTISNHNGIKDTANYSVYVTQQPNGISNALATELNLKISPIPAHDNIQVSLILTDKNIVNVSIIDITGHTVYSSLHNNLPAGNNELSIATSSLRQGIYLIKIAADNNIATSKLVIQ